MAENTNYALVTGASSGIGWCLSEALAKRGYSIIAVSNQAVQLNDLKVRMEQTFGVTVIPLNIDLSLSGSASEIFETVQKQNIFVEVLINNAGMFLFGEAARADYSDTRSMLTLNMVTPALLCRLFGEQMIVQKKGYILTISSITARMPYPGISVYAPTKAFLRHYTRALRSEMKLYGIKVTCLIPGAVSTSLYGTDKYNRPLFRMLGLMKTPENVANAGIKALFRDRPECIPGFLNKIIFFLIMLVPHSLISLINKRTGLIRHS